MPKHAHSLPTRIHRRRRGTPSVGSPLFRQWKLMELLASDRKGATVNTLARLLGFSTKTIRRDLILFKQIGFDVAETVEEFGRKVWRIRHPFETMRSKRRQYRTVEKSLAVLIEQAQAIGDQRLVAGLEAMRRKVERKGR